MREKDKDKYKTGTIYVRVTKQQLEAIDKIALQNYRSRPDEIRKMIDICLANDDYIKQGR